MTARSEGDRFGQGAERVEHFAPREKAAGDRQFEARPDGYVLRVPEIATELKLRDLRRERGELVGELAVGCKLPGALTFDGSLSVASFNVSSAWARQDRAKLLRERSRAADVDWLGVVEELAQRVLRAERVGEPAVDLRALPVPDRDEIQVEGFAFPRRHPNILFGDGGAAKSYTALWLAGRLAQEGVGVGVFDWELGGEEHRERLGRLFGADMPPIWYVRCERPLTAEAERLRCIVREHGIEFAVFDSIAFACDGPPESAEVAARYFRGVRRIGVGSLHLAHTTKAEGGEKKPLGSTFWHNGARQTWFVKAAEQAGDERTLRLGFFNRKANLGPIRSPLGFTVEFGNDATTFTPSNVADTSDLAVNMTIRQRMRHVLKYGALTAEEVAEAIGAKPDTVARTIRRHKQEFTVIEGGKVALLQQDK